jgi:hypothetical protein
VVDLEWRLKEMKQVAGDGERDYTKFDRPTNQRRKLQNEKGGLIPKSLEKDLGFLTCLLS